MAENERPLYVTEQDDGTIRQRMLDRMPNTYDKAEGSFAWDAVAPAAVEFAQANVQTQRILEVRFKPTGVWLELLADEVGLTRREATAGKGTVTFTGTPGTVITAGRPVSTATTATRPAVLFATDAAVTLDGTGQGTVGVTATTPGAASNVAAGTITFLGEPIPGVTGVTNGAPTTGGTDTESDDALWERYLNKRRNPSAGGNKADYENWAMEVPGVGGLSVVPVRDGPGTVSVAIIDTDKRPATQTLVDAVQNYIAPPWAATVEAEAMTTGGFGVSVDTTQGDDNANSIKMVYSASGQGTLTQPTLQNGLPKRGDGTTQPGIWQARIRAKVSSVAGATNLLQVGVWNVTAGAWAKTRPAGSVDAVRTLRAADLATAFAETLQEFYWNGTDVLELRANRLTTDTSTTLWIDQVTYRSAFSKDDGTGKAPVGPRVTVEAAKAITVNVTATLVIAAGYDAATVKTAAAAAVAAYITGQAFAKVNGISDHTIRYGRVGQALLDTVGVQDYSSLLVNGASTNVTVGEQEVAVVGSVTLT
jgi:uncharacterized phage protein gp47/JayE